MSQEDRALALGGLLQACHLVTAIARTGMVSQDSLAGSLETIFVTNPGNTFDVYQGGAGVRTGLRLICETLGDFQMAEHGDTLRYAMSVIQLEKKIRQSPDMLREIGAGISGIQEHRALGELAADDNDVVNRLSALYERTAGTIEPRIRVLGVQKHLQNTNNTSRIRALLLAALRSAVLWRQLKGSLPGLFFARARLLRAADNVAQIVN